MNKKVIFILSIFYIISLSLQSAYNASNYMKISEVNGEVKITSQNTIIKPARFGDLLFTKDNIYTEYDSSLCSYLENNNVFKLDSNSHLIIEESFDRNLNTKLLLNQGNIMMVSSHNIKTNIIYLQTPNANIIFSGVILVSYDIDKTKVQLLYGDGSINGIPLKQFMEASIDESKKVITNEIYPLYTTTFTNSVNELLSIPYVRSIFPNITNLYNVSQFETSSNNLEIKDTNKNIFIITNDAKKN